MSKKMISIPQIANCNLDFNNRDNSKISKLTTLNVTLTTSITNKIIPINYYKVEITNIQLDSVNVRNINKLLQIKINSEGRELISNKIENFKVTQNNPPLTIIFNPAEIIEYLGEDNTSYIVFQFVTQDKIKSEPFATKLKLKINFTKEQPTSETEFVLESKFKNPYTYENINKLKIGEFHLKRKNIYSFSENLNIDAMIKQKHRDIIFFDDIKHIQTVYSNVQIIQDDNELQINNISDELIKIPVFINLSKIENPDNFQKYNFEILYNKGKEKLQESFTIKEQQSEAGLFFKITSLGQDVSTSSNNLPIKLKPIIWKPLNKGKAICFTFYIGNKAKVGVANKNNNIEIKNLSIVFSKTEGSEITYNIGNNKIEDIFDFPDTSNKIYTFEPKEDSYQNFDIKLLYKSIKTIPERKFTVSCTIKYTYILHGKENEKSHELIFEVQKTLGNKFLTLDLGTSATVATWGIVGNNTEINLQDSLEKHIPKDEYTLDNIDEFGNDNLLSSTIALVNEGKINSQNYKEDVIRISPTIKIQESQPERLLPYLKSLINYEYLPDEKEINLKYFNEKNEEREYKEYPIKLNSLLSNTYNSIIRDFIVPQLEKKGENDDFNKITLTIPNTFTPRHISFIKNVFLTKYKKYFEEDRISFVTESDAVAYYYIANWDLLNGNRTDKTKLAEGTEYVLVYDMGAGTLDITYLKIDSKTENGMQKKRIEILGKIGKLTAGNYLDYILAKEIYDNNNEAFKFDIEGDDARTLPDLMKYKTIIKDKIKPNLHTLKNFKFKEIFGDLTIQDDTEYNISSLKESKLFKEYIENNSVNLFKDFFSFISNNDKIKIDTLMMTGRASQLKDLKSAVIKNLKEVTKNNNIKEINLTNGNDIKTVVAKGAGYKVRFDLRNSGITFVNKDKIFGQYGIIHKELIGNKWKFELFYNDEIYQKSEVNVFEKTIFLAQSEECHFIHSFSSDPAKNMNDNNEEYITKMLSFSVSEFFGETDTAHEAKIKVSINKYKEIIIEFVDIFEDAPSAPLQIKTDNKIFQQSMWPYYNFT